MAECCAANENASSDLPAELRRMFTWVFDFFPTITQQLLSLDVIKILLCMLRRSSDVFEQPAHFGLLKWFVKSFHS